MTEKEIKRAACMSFFALIRLLLVLLAKSTPLTRGAPPFVAYAAFPPFCGGIAPKWKARKTPYKPVIALFATKKRSRRVFTTTLF